MLVDLGRHDRFGIPHLIVGLQQRHHRQQRLARVIRRRQLGFKRLVEQLGADLAQEHVRRWSFFARRCSVAFSGVETCQRMGVGMQITSRSPSRSTAAEFT